MFDVSVTIASFNTREVLKQCLLAVYQQTGVKFEVIVVDNASLDNSAEMVKREFPQANLVRNQKNLYLTRGQNQALNLAKGRYVLVLNSDVILGNGCLRKLAEFLDRNKEAGVVAPKMINKSGRVEPNAFGRSTPITEFFQSTLLGRLSKNNPIMNAYRMVNFGFDRIKSVDTVSFACLMARRDLLSKLSGYDDNLIMYYQEDDFCRRIKKLGFKIFFNPEGQATHLVRQSVDLLDEKKLKDLYHQDMYYYHKKYYGRLAAAVLFLLISVDKLIFKLRDCFYSSSRPV